MAIPSNMLPLNSLAPEFDLPDTISGDQTTLEQLKGQKGTLIIFMCNHCPYVIHIKEQLIDIANSYRAKGINTIAISSNDIDNYPEDAPDKMTELMAEWDNPFDAYLYDESQQVAKDYMAACTPDIYLFDEHLACVYRGRLDGSTPRNDVPLTGEDLRPALEALVTGRDISSEQIPSMGCGIKWKA